MANDKRVVAPGPGRSLIGEYGEKLTPPEGWAFLPAGDAGVTRKVTGRGMYWRVQVKKGRRVTSKGVWAPKETILWAQKEVAGVRSTEAYAKRKVYDKERRDQKQQAYEVEFCRQVGQYLAFHSKYKLIEQLLAKAVTKHAIPVGSGTVARTSLIPVEERAAKAVIAWMRHNTTAYDNMTIAKIKGERRTVRRALAQRSIAVLEDYRKGNPINSRCPLGRVVKGWLDSAMGKAR